MSGGSWKAIYIITFATLAILIGLTAPVHAESVLQTAEFASDGVWYAPSDVTSVSLDLQGGGEGGTGGGYAYRTSTETTVSVPGVGGSNGTYLHVDNVAVTPGTMYTITVGRGGPANQSWYWAQSASANATRYYNTTPGSATSAFGYTANGGNGINNNVTIIFNTVDGWSYVMNGTSQGSNGYGTSQYANTGGTSYGACTYSGIAGYDGGSGYGAGGGGGAAGIYQTGGVTCAGGAGGEGASGFVRISYLTETSSTTAWYSQQLVQLTAVDSYSRPLKRVNITVNYLASSLPNTNASFLTDAFGVSNTVALLMTNSSVAMMGETDDTGSLSFLMFPALTYGITVSNASQGVSNYVQIAPKDQYYTIKCPTTGQAAVNNTLNATLTSRLTFYQLNTSYYNLSMIYHDPDGYTTNLVFEVIDYTGGNVAVYSHDWGSPGTNIIVDNYTVYCPLGQEYLWRWNATKTG